MSHFFLLINTSSYVAYSRVELVVGCIAPPTANRCWVDLYATSYIDSMGARHGLLSPTPTPSPPLHSLHHSDHTRCKHNTLTRVARLPYNTYTVSQSSCQKKTPLFLWCRSIDHEQWATFWVSLKTLFLHCSLVARKMSQYNKTIYRDIFLATRLV